jgi:hypothetical protein
MLSEKSATRKDIASGIGDMQHRHFATIAAIIARIPDAGYRQDMAEHFADNLRSTNPRFDRARFLTAAGNRK